MLAARAQSISDASSSSEPLFTTRTTEGVDQPVIRNWHAETATRLFEPGYLHGQYGFFPGCPTTEVEQPGRQT